MLSASCHCGAVSLEIDRKPRSLTDCNCSICRRYGALWAYYTRKSVRVSCAPGSMSIHAWGRRSLEFHHCRTCGCVMFHECSEKAGESTRVGVNARMMDPEEIAHPRVRRLDGASTWKYLD